MTDHPDASPEFSEGLRKILNSHGYGFQYAILNKGKQLSEARLSNWRFEAAEVPVITGGTTTHIDFLLWNGEPTARTYLIAECKRAEPARARWGFAQAPYTWRNAISGRIIVEQVCCEPPDNRILDQNPYSDLTDQGPYHYGVELKTPTAGEGRERGTRAINDAVAQVLRGTSGYINYLFSNFSFTTKTRLRFIPVIFTTAELWITDADLSQAELDTGTLARERVMSRTVDYLWFTHNRSPVLRHDLRWQRTEGEISTVLQREFARSIAIVSPGGIQPSDPLPGPACRGV